MSDLFNEEDIEIEMPHMTEPDSSKQELTSHSL